MELRNTKQKRLILANINNRSDHPTAEQIYQQVSLYDQKISLSTVYRNLDNLSKENKIKHIKTPGSDHYDFRLDDHYHVLCLKCGKVSDVSLPYVNEYDKLAEQSSGFKIEKHDILFEGICPECQLKEGHKE